MIERKRYTLEEKPNFYDGEMVQVDMSCLGIPPKVATIETGKIVGKSSTHILDVWLIEFNRVLYPTSYPYKVIGIQHTFILKNP